MMTSRRRSLFLIQLLISIAVPALPLALYSPVIRDGAGRLSRRILLALVSHCVELEAFV